MDFDDTLDKDNNSENNIDSNCEEEDHLLNKGEYNEMDADEEITESHKFKQVHDNKNNEDDTGAILTLGEKVASDICSVPT